MECLKDGKVSMIKTDHSGRDAYKLILLSKNQSLIDTIFSSSDACFSNTKDYYGRSLTEIIRSTEINPRIPWVLKQNAELSRIFFLTLLTKNPEQILDSVVNCLSPVVNIISSYIY